MEALEDKWASSDFIAGPRQARLPHSSTSSYLWYQRYWATLLSSPWSDRSVSQDLCVVLGPFSNPDQTNVSSSSTFASTDRKEAAPPPALLHFLSATSLRDTIGGAFIQQPHKVTRQRLRCEEKGNGGREKLRSDPPVKDERGEWGRGKPEDWPLPIRLFLLLVLQLKNETVA